MELKLDAAYLLNKQLKVLIVPYGIETHISFPLSVCLQNVLIVPYGIET